MLKGTITSSKNKKTTDLSRYSMSFNDSLQYAVLQTSGNTIY